MPIIGSTIDFSSHPTSCSSMAEITSVLFYSVMRYDPKDPRNPAADRFVLSKVTASPFHRRFSHDKRCSLYPRVIVLQFCTLHGLKPVHFQLRTWRTYVKSIRTWKDIPHRSDSKKKKIDFGMCQRKFFSVWTLSMLQRVHWAKVWVSPVVWRTPVKTSINPTIEFTAYSVMVSSMKAFCSRLNRVFCCAGECSEGSVWESFAFGSFYHLDNLCAVIDVNRLGQSDPAPLQHDLETYRKRVEAFG